MCIIPLWNSCFKKFSFVWFSPYNARMSKRRILNNWLRGATWSSLEKRLCDDDVARERQSALSSGLFLYVHRWCSRPLRKRGGFSHTASSLRVPLRASRRSPKKMGPVYDRGVPGTLLTKQTPGSKYLYGGPKARLRTGLYAETHGTRDLRRSVRYENSMSCVSCETIARANFLVRNKSLGVRVKILRMYIVFAHSSADSYPWD